MIRIFGLKLFHAFNIHCIKYNEQNAYKTGKPGRNSSKEIIAEEIKGNDYTDNCSKCVNVKTHPSQIPH